MFSRPLNIKLGKASTTNEFWLRVQPTSRSGQSPGRKSDGHCCPWSCWHRLNNPQEICVWGGNMRTLQRKFMSKKKRCTCSRGTLVANLNHKSSLPDLIYISHDELKLGKICQFGSSTHSSLQSDPTSLKQLQRAYLLERRAENDNEGFLCGKHVFVLPPAGFGKGLDTPN